VTTHGHAGHAGAAVGDMFVEQVCQAHATGVSVADQRATRGPLTTKGSRLRHEALVSSLIKEYFKSLKEKKMPRLINGDDLIKKFKLNPSSLIGKILSEIEELQAIGRIKSKPEALKTAARIIKEEF